MADELGAVCGLQAKGACNTEGVKAFGANEGEGLEEREGERSVRRGEDSPAKTGDEGEMELVGVMKRGDGRGESERICF